MVASTSKSTKGKWAATEYNYDYYNNPYPFIAKPAAQSTSSS